MTLMISMMISLRRTMYKALSKIIKLTENTMCLRENAGIFKMRNGD